MAKSYLFFIFVFIFGLISFAQQVEIKSSRLHGLLVFTYSNMGRPHYSSYLKEMTEKSEFGEQMKQIMSGSGEVVNILNHGMTYNRNVEGYGDGFNVSDLYEIQSAYAKDIDDLFVRTEYTMPLNELMKFKSILKEVDPIYEKLVWEPNKKKLAEIEKLYQQNLKTWNVSSLFNKAKTFYNSSWPEEQNFLITLYPIPQGAKSSNAHSLMAFESVGVIIGEKDHAGRFGVIFHEIMHSLYSAQATEFKKELYSYYSLERKDQDLPYRKGAHKFANEVFATTLGNGWFYEAVTGKLDDNAWYNDKYIEALSRGMFEHTKNYLAQNKKIDREYIEFYIQTFKKLFPNYPEEKDYIFRELQIYHTNKIFKTQDIRNSFRSLFRSSSLSISGSSTLLAEKTQIDDKLANMFLLSMEEAKKASARFYQQINLPKKIRTQVSKGSTGMWKWVDKDGNIRVLAIVNPEQIKDLFSQDFKSY